MRQANLYMSIKVNVEEHGYCIETCCDILHVSRSAYYRWLSGKVGERTKENERIAEIVEQIHAESPDKGYRRIRDDLERYHTTRFGNDYKLISSIKCSRVCPRNLYNEIMPRLPCLNAIRIRPKPDLNKIVLPSSPSAYCCAAPQAAHSRQDLQEYPWPE